MFYGGRSDPDSNPQGSTIDNPTLLYPKYCRQKVLSFLCTSTEAVMVPFSQTLQFKQIPKGHISSPNVFASEMDNIEIQIWTPMSIYGEGEV